MFLKVFALLAFVAVVLGSNAAIKKKQAPQPYHFGYRTKSEHGTQFRTEKSDGKGAVHGSYGYTDPAGTYREVHYVADHNGFRAKITTNEHGTADQDPANIAIKSDAVHHFGEKINVAAKPIPAKTLQTSSPTPAKKAAPKYAKYSDVRFFHFGSHSHEEKRGNEDEEPVKHEDEESVKNEEELSEDEGSEEDEYDDDEEREDEDAGDEAEERTMFHRIGQHGGHE